jgi:hypothetical protein
MADPVSPTTIGTSGEVRAFTFGLYVSLLGGIAALSGVVMSYYPLGLVGFVLSAVGTSLVALALLHAEDRRRRVDG